MPSVRGCCAGVMAPARHLQTLSQGAVCQGCAAAAMLSMAMLAALPECSPRQWARALAGEKVWAALMQPWASGLDTAGQQLCWALRAATDPSPPTHPPQRVRGFGLLEGGGMGA